MSFFGDKDLLKDMEVSKYSTDKAKEVTDLFYLSVHDIDSSVYSEKKKEAWAPTPPDYKKWSARLSEKKPYIASINNIIVGFIELEPDGHIDCTYIHPAYKRKGIGKSLYLHIEEIAKSRLLTRLYVEASIVAVQFFMQMGFITRNENYIEINDEVLINYSMEKLL